MHFAICICRNPRLPRTTLILLATNEDYEAAFLLPLSLHQFEAFGAHGAVGKQVSRNWLLAFTYISIVQIFLNVMILLVILSDPSPSSLPGTHLLLPDLTNKLPRPPPVSLYFHYALFPSADSLPL